MILGLKHLLFMCERQKKCLIPIQTDIESSIYLLELSTPKKCWHPLNRHNILPACGAFGSQSRTLQTEGCKGTRDGWMRNE